MFRKTKIALAFLATALLLVACSGSPPKRIFAPTASIQELVAQADGQWHVTVRIQSFSNVPHTVSDLSAELRVDGVQAATLRLTPQVAIGPQSAEVEDLLVTPAAEAASRVQAALKNGRRVEYVLHGTLTSTVPDKRRDDFTFEGQLWPMPGLPGVLR